MIAFTRCPCLRRALTIGDVSSMRLPSGGMHAVDERIHFAVVLEAVLRSVKNAICFIEESIRSVHHDLGYAFVTQELLKRTKSEHTTTR